MQTRLPLAVTTVLFALACGGGGSDEVTPPIGNTPPTGPIATDCMGFCQHTAECWTAEGKQLGADEMDCPTSCQQPQGTYVHMGAVGMSCATVACGPQFDECSFNAVMSVLGSGVLDPPSDWPAGYPMFYGGVPIPFDNSGMPVKTWVYSFPLSTNALAGVVRAEVKRNGWSVDSDGSAPEAGGETIRISASKDGSIVSASIYADPGTPGNSVLQIIH